MAGKNIDSRSIDGGIGSLNLWALIVDDFSSHCWSYFSCHKSDLKDNGRK
jgi:hypothetical protein